jgi:hypothetical protein
MILRRKIVVTLAAAEGLAEPFVGQAVAFAAIGTGHEEAAVVGFDMIH